MFPRQRLGIKKTIIAIVSIDIHHGRPSTHVCMCINMFVSYPSRMYHLFNFYKISGGNFTMEMTHFYKVLFFNLRKVYDK